MKQGRVAGLCREGFAMERVKARVQAEKSLLSFSPSTANICWVSRQSLSHKQHTCGLWNQAVYVEQPCLYSVYYNFSEHGESCHILNDWLEGICMMSLHWWEMHGRKGVKVTTLGSWLPLPNRKFSFSPCGKDSAMHSPSCVHSIPEHIRKSHFPVRLHLGRTMRLSYGRSSITSSDTATHIF